MSSLDLGLTTDDGECCGHRQIRTQYHYLRLPPCPLRYHRKYQQRKAQARLKRENHENYDEVRSEGEMSSLDLGLTTDDGEYETQTWL
jgi:hypothetical protein